MTWITSIDHGRDEDPSADFSEDWERQAAECPLSDSSWAKIAAALERGGCLAGYAGALRPYLTVKIDLHRTMMPDTLTRLREDYPRFNGPVAQASGELLKLLKSKEGALAEFDLANPVGFLLDLEQLAALAKQRSVMRFPASRRRLDRDASWSQFVDWWISLELPVRTSLTSPIVAFISAVSEELPWLNVHDRSPENIRAFLRKKVRTEQSDQTGFEPEDGEGK